MFMLPLVTKLELLIQALRTGSLTFSKLEGHLFILSSQQMSVIEGVCARVYVRACVIIFRHAHWAVEKANLAGRLSEEVLMVGNKGHPCGELCPTLKLQHVTTPRGSTANSNKRRTVR